MYVTHIKNPHGIWFMVTISLDQLPFTKKQSNMSENEFVNQLQLLSCPSDIQSARYK